MFADTLLAAERTHLLHLLVWGAASIVAGTAILALVARRAESALLRWFGIQTLAWGAVDASVAAFGLRGLALRDYAGATRLDRLLWLNTGLDVGYVAVGATLATAGWMLGRRLGALGAGAGVVVQGAALLLLDLRFLAFTTTIP